jgi:hypothetical protein
MSPGLFLSAIPVGLTIAILVISLQAVGSLVTQCECYAQGKRQAIVDDPANRSLREEKLLPLTRSIASQLRRLARFRSRSLL